MDPKQALIDAEAHLLAGELEAAAERLADYRAWRNCGGFEGAAGGDQLALDLERRLAEARDGGAAPDKASNVRIARSCGWCHAINPETERYCLACGHEAHVARTACRCPRCTRGPEPITETDIEAVLAELRRRQAQTQTNEGDALTTSEDAARALYLRDFRAAFEREAGKPLPEGFEDAEIEAYRQRGVPAASAAQDFLAGYWLGGRLLP